MTLNEFIDARIAPDQRLYNSLTSVFKHEIRIPEEKRSDKEYDNASEWLKENIPGDDYVELAYRYFFKHSFHAIQFKLACGY